MVTIDETGFERYAGPVNASWGTGEGLSSGVLDEKEVESGGQVVQAGDVEQGLRVIIHYDDDEEERRLIRKVHEGTCALGQIVSRAIHTHASGDLHSGINFSSTCSTFRSLLVCRVCSPNSGLCGVCSCWAVCSGS